MAPPASIRPRNASQSHPGPGCSAPGVVGKSEAHVRPANHAPPALSDVITLMFVPYVSWANWSRRAVAGCCAVKDVLKKRSARTKAAKGRPMNGSCDASPDGARAWSRRDSQRGRQLSGRRRRLDRKIPDVSRIRYFETIVASFFARPGDAFRYLPADSTI